VGGWGACLCVIGAGMVGGCVGAPGIPGGPLQGTGVTLSGSYGYAAAPARITMRSTNDGHSDSYSDPAADAVNFPLLPSRLGGRVGITKWFDAAGDLALIDSGFEFRAGLPEGAQPLPMALSLGVRRGTWGLETFANHRSSEQRLRFEAYPRIAQWSGRARLNLISTLGVSTGHRFHPLRDSARFGRSNPNGGADEGPMIPTPDFAFHTYVYRDETRVDGSLGIELRQWRFYSSLVLMPYVVTSSGRPLGVCEGCGDWELQSFRSNFGATLFLTLGVSFLLEPTE
jgi:hypothetical protein